mgnify:CR=1 FL=1
MPYVSETIACRLRGRPRWGCLPRLPNARQPATFTVLGLSNAFFRSVRPDTKRHFHFGVNFVFSPPVNFTAERFAEFQRLLAEPSCGLAFDALERHPSGSAVSLRRTSGSPLVVTVQSPAPPISQLLIIASNPSCLKRDFVAEADSVIQAFVRLMGAPNQLLNRDCTIRHLYAVSEDHAFRYLWERRLSQGSESFSVLGRPILGGGLRLVLPARPDVAEDPVVELKYESLLNDSNLLFLECQFAWQTTAAGDKMLAEPMIAAVEDFITEHAVPFIMPETHE